MSASTSTSLLDRVTIQNPCTADWNAMRGDDQVRHCGDCKLNVYNVAAMERSEAEALIREKEGSGGELCMRLSVRPDGTIVTAGCLSVAQRLRRRMQLIAAVFVGLFGLGTTVMAAQAADSGGLNSWRTWKKAPFGAVAAYLPAWLVPQEPIRRISGSICVRPAPTPVVVPDSDASDELPVDDSTPNR